MAKILMLLNQFSPKGEPEDPPHQLADAFVSQGHIVKVVVIPWQRQESEVSIYDEGDALKVMRVPALRITRFGNAIGLIIRWVFSSLVARRYLKSFLRDDSFDLVYTTSPLVTMAFVLRWVFQRYTHARFYLYIVDFFPFHQRAIGLIPSGWMFRFAKKIENALIQKFDVVACMSPRNVAYLQNHYTLRAGQQVTILPLSTAIAAPLSVDKDTVRRRLGLPLNRVIAIFGGQITEGRGIEQILETARLAKHNDAGLHFVLAGNGRLVHMVQAYISTEGGNLTHLQSLDRDSYLELATACDIGLVVTVPIADIPTFPSKTLDYLQASLPVVAAVEDDTDFRDFVETHGFGRVVRAGDSTELLAVLETLARDAEMRYAMAEAGKRTLHDIFDVRQAVMRILAEYQSTADGESRSNNRNDPYLQMRDIGSDQ